MHCYISWLQAPISVPAPGPARSDQAISDLIGRVYDCAVYKSRYWQSCFAGRELYDYVVVPIQRTVTTFAHWVVVCRKTRGAFSADDIDRARPPSPHIKRSVEISGVLGRQRVEAVPLRAVLEALASAALVIKPDRTILFGHRPAEAKLARARLIREHGRRLMAVTPAGQTFMAMLPSAPDRTRQNGSARTKQIPAGEASMRLGSR